MSEIEQLNEYLKNLIYYCNYEILLHNKYGNVYEYLSDDRIFQNNEITYEFSLIIEFWFEKIGSNKPVNYAQDKQRFYEYLKENYNYNLGLTENDLIELRKKNKNELSKLEKIELAKLKGFIEERAFIKNCHFKLIDLIEQYIQHRYIEFKKNR